MNIMAGRPFSFLSNMPKTRNENSQFPAGNGCPAGLIVRYRFVCFGLWYSETDGNFGRSRCRESCKPARCIWKVTVPGFLPRHSPVLPFFPVKKTAGYGHVLSLNCRGYTCEQDTDTGKNGIWLFFRLISRKTDRLGGYPGFTLHWRDGVVRYEMTS